MLHQIVDAELHLTYFGGKEYIYLRPSYDLRQPTIRRLAKGRHSRLDPEPGADGATHPHYHTNSGTRLGAAPDRLVK